MSPTARTLKRLREEGWRAQVVERFNRFANVRQDLFGVIDVVAINDLETVGVQACAAASLSARFEKIRNSEDAKLWCAGPNRRLEIHAWRKGGPRGKRKVWTVNRVPIEF